MTTRTSRALRGAAFAVLSTLAAAAAHTLGGGGAPTPLFCAIVAAIALPFAVLLSGPRVRAWRTWTVVGASQLVFHALFATTGDLGAWAAGDPGAHAHGAIALGAADAVSTVMPLTADMLLAHALAAVVTAAVLRRGERVIVAVRRWTRRAIARIPAPVLAPAVRPVAVVVLERPLVPRSRVAAHPLSRRGPPRLSPAV